MFELSQFTGLIPSILKLVPLFWHDKQTLDEVGLNGGNGSI